MFPRYPPSLFVQSFNIISLALNTEFVGNRSTCKQIKTVPLSHSLSMLSSPLSSLPDSLSLVGRYFVEHRTTGKQKVTQRGTPPPPPSPPSLLGFQHHFVNLHLLALLLHCFVCLICFVLVHIDTHILLPTCHVHVFSGVETCRLQRPDH